MSTSRLARGAGLFSIVLLMLGAYGCDQLGMGGKTETKKDTAKADKDDDDDDAKDKKKKKKKKDKDDDDDDDEKAADAKDAKDAKEKPAATVADVPTPPPVPPPVATVASGGSTGNATCDAYLKGMDCLMGKMPPQAQASFAQSKAQMEQAFKSLGNNAETACKSALDAVQPSLAQYGCGTGGSTAAPPPPPLPPTAPPATTGGGNSPVPSVADWDGVTNEVTVSGSSALNCETKMLREWVRVSCRGKNSTGGTPTTVNITSGGGRGNEFVFASAGVTSLVVRFVQGVDLKADFGWTDGSYSLHVWWPRGAPEPPAKGVFTRN